MISALFFIASRSLFELNYAPLRFGLDFLSHSFSMGSLSRYFGLDSSTLYFVCESLTLLFGDLQTRLLHTLKGIGQLTSASNKRLQLLAQVTHARQTVVVFVDRIDLFFGHPLLLLNSRSNISKNPQR